MDSRMRTTILGVAAVGLATIALVSAQVAPGKAAVEKIVKDYLIANPEILIDVQNALDRKQAANEAQSQQTALTKIGEAALTDPKVAFIQGPADAKVTVVQFFDYHCGFCKASLPAMKKALERGGSVRFAFVEYPILSAESLIAAQAAVAARQQPGKYMAFHIALMETTGALPRERILSIAQTVGLDIPKLEMDMASDATRASLQASNALAQQLHVNGTPTFVINGKFLVGQIDDAELTKLLKDGQA